MRKSLYEETKAHSDYIFPPPPTNNPELQFSVLSLSGLLFLMSHVSSPESLLNSKQLHLHSGAGPPASAHAAGGLCNTLDLHCPHRLERWMLFGEVVDTLGGRGLMEAVGPEELALEG